MLGCFIYFMSHYKQIILIQEPWFGSWTVMLWESRNVWTASAVCESIFVTPAGKFKTHETKIKLDGEKIHNTEWQNMIGDLVWPFC